MSERKEEASRIVLTNGSAVVITVRSGIIIDDILVQGAKAEAYRLMTGQDVFAEIGRDVKDYLIKTGVILE